MHSMPYERETMTNNEIKNLIKKEDWQKQAGERSTNLSWEEWFTEEYIELLEAENRKIEIENKELKRRLYNERWII